MIIVLELAHLFPFGLSSRVCGVSKARRPLSAFDTILRIYSVRTAF